MLLTPEYVQLNKELHAKGAYGFKGHHYAARVAKLAVALGSRDILDYGCGARTLEKALNIPIRNYDPCIEGLDETPEPADIVVCTDVLEHIEPDCLDNVLDDLKRVTRNTGFFTIDTRPARKFLSDGRNAHLIQQPAGWWFPKLYERWPLVQVTNILIRKTKSLGFQAIVRCAED